MSGRLASEKDVKEGRAVFYLSRKGGTEAEPLKLKLPVCAIHTDQETKKETPVILVQAERADGKEIIGYRPLDGGNGVGLKSEFTILAKPDERFKKTTSKQGGGAKR